MTDEGPAPPTALPDSVRGEIDEMDVSELRALRTYVEGRIASLRSGIEGEIRAEAAGEVVAVESHGEYALVKQHPSAREGAGANEAVTSLYHVTREPHLDGTDSLHWAYLGDVRTGDARQCESCGRTIGTAHDVCPHCGGDPTDGDGGEE